MLKDVGITVPKSRETSAAREGKRACNNDNMCNPSLHLLLVEILSIGGEHERSNCTVVSLPVWVQDVVELGLRTIGTHIKHYGMCGNAVWK